MKRKLISVFCGTLILFIWNAISWMALPFHGNSLKNIPESAIDTEVLKEKMSEDGVYHFPGLPKEGGYQHLNSIQEQLEKGPRITLMVYKQGPTELFKPKTFIINLFFNFVSVALLLIIVERLKNKSFKKILSTLLLIALLIGFMSDFPQMNWYMFPFTYSIIEVLDHLISIGLLSLLFYFYTFKPSNSEKSDGFTFSSP